MAPQFDRALRDLLRAAGCAVVRQGKGSHEIWHSPLTKRNFAVPVGIPSRRTANAILRQAGLPIVLDKVPNTNMVQLQINVDSHLLVEAKSMRPPADAGAVEFVFKYGLALIAMGLLNSAKRTDEWTEDEVGARERILALPPALGALLCRYA